MNNISETIDVEAAPAEDQRVSLEIVEHDMASVHGEEWSSTEETVDKSDPLMLSLEQWLGVDAVRGMKASEIEALRRGVARLPKPEGEESFVWDAIREPSDISLVAEAIVGYRQFPVEAVVIADAMGPNSHFRKIIKGARLPVTAILSDFLDKEKSRVALVRQFMTDVDGLKGGLTSLFGDQDFPVSAAIVALVGADSIASGLSRLDAGFVLPRPVHDGDLEALDRLRRNVVGASDSVRRACAVVPLQYSRGVLSGVRRSISERRAGDFVFAVEALGGRMETKDHIAEAGRAFVAYLSAMDTFTDAASSIGFSLGDEPALVAHLLVRRHLRSAARSMSVDWAAIAPFLSVKTDMNAADFAEALQEITKPGLSGKLKSSSHDVSRPLGDVREAAYRFAVSREYWLEAGRRVMAVRPDATLHEIKQVMEVEPAIAQSKDILRRYGVTARDEVDPLERHLEWMISAYALPIPDMAVERIIETKAGIIPLRLVGSQ